MIGPRLIIASAALWCVAGISAGIMRSTQENAPAPAAESDEPVITEILAKGDRLPLAPVQAITDRWLDAPAERADELRLVEPQVVPAKGGVIQLRRVAPLHAPRDICTRHGMHKVITRGGRSWRCRR
jgi:hypothetical protein